MLSDDVEFTSFTAAKLRFVINWNGGPAGVYPSSIDNDGFVSGTSRDRWDSGSTADWRMRGRAVCVR